jgi:glycine reductase
MSDGLRVVHYVNQFFAGVGGEDQAGVGPARAERLSGPSTALQAALGDAGHVVATVYCGDNHVAEYDAAVERIVELIGREAPDVVLAGPAFAAGRYGLACGKVALTVKERLGIVGVAAMHRDNPAADLYRAQVYVVGTTPTAAGMADALRRMASLAVKLHRGAPVGSPAEEGYLPTGRRLLVFAEHPAADRTLHMLLRKLRGEPFATEWPVPTYGAVPAAPPVPELARATIAVITTGGLVPRGNPDRLESAYATKWLKYSLKDVDRLEPRAWQSVHGGFDTTMINADPHRLVPLDVLRALEARGAFGRLHNELYTTVGNTSSIPTMRRFAQEMAGDLRATGVDGVILTST